MPLPVDHGQATTWEAAPISIHGAVVVSVGICYLWKNGLV